MKYVVPIIFSLTIFILPTIGNKNISWEMVFIIFGYFWFGIFIGEDIEKNR